MKKTLLACASLFAPQINVSHFFQETWLDLILEPDILEKAQEVLQWCETNEAKITYPSAVDYPERCLELEFPPLFLSYWGSPCWKGRAAFAIVGSREPTPLALEWMEYFLPKVFRRGNLFVVSGAARGIDQKAHRLSLLHGAPTLALLPTGLAQVYPKDFLQWIQPIRNEGGAVMSEFPPMATLWRHHFERRNRIIAAMAHLVLVVEARRRSGSTMTARLAHGLSRAVCAVPNSPLVSKALGTLDLLLNDSILVRDDLDLNLLLDPFRLLSQETTSTPDVN